MKMIFYYHANKTHFHNKGFALGLVLRGRVFGTRKWPIDIEHFHTRDRWPYFFHKAKESVCIIKEFNSHNTDLEHQYDQLFIVSVH